MDKMNELKALLYDMDCTTQHVAELVNEFREDSNGHRRLPCVSPWRPTSSI